MRKHKFFLTLLYLLFIFYSTNVLGYSLSLPETPYSVTSADFNHDGKNDIAVGFNGAIIIFWGNNLGQFSLENVKYILFNGRADKLVPADVNSDGWVDLIVSDRIKNRLKVLVNLGADFVLHDEVNSFAPNAIVTGYINDDNYLDIVVPNPGGGIGVFCGKGNYGLDNETWFNYEIMGGVYNIFNNIKLQDVDSDGTPEIIGLSGNNIYVLKNNNNNLSVISTMQTGNTPSDIACADFNHDNIIDLVISNNLSNSVMIYYGLSEGGNISFNSQPVIYNVGLTPISLIIGDFNSDSYLDIVVLCAASNEIYFLLSTGFGNFTIASSVLSLTQRPSAFLANDFNINGKFDIATISEEDNSLSVFLDNEINNTLNFKIPSVDVKVGVNNGAPSDGPITIDINSTQSLQVYLSIDANDMHGYLADLYLELEVFEPSEGGNVNIVHYSISDTGISNVENPFMLNWQIVNFPLSVVYNISIWDLLGTIGHPASLNIKAKLVIKQNSSLPLMHVYTGDLVKVQFNIPFMTNPSVDVKVGVNNGAPSDGPITIDINSTQSLQVYLSIDANDMRGYLADLYLELEVFEPSEGGDLNIIHYSISDTEISNVEKPFVSNWQIVNFPLSVVYNISIWDLLGTIGHPASLNIKAKLVIKQDSSLPLMHVYTSDLVKVQFNIPFMTNPSVDVKVGVNNGAPSDGPITIDMKSTQSLQIYLGIDANDMRGYLADLYLELEVFEPSEGGNVNIVHYSISDTGISNVENPFMSNWQIVNFPLSVVYNISIWDLLGTIGHPASLNIKAKLVIKQNSSLPLTHVYTSDLVKVQFNIPFMTNPSVDVKVGVNNGAPSDGPITIDINSTQSLQIYLGIDANDMRGYLADLYLELEVFENTENEHVSLTHYSISESGISNVEKPFVSNWQIVNFPLSVVYNISIWDLLGTIGHPASLNIKAKLVIKQDSSLPPTHIYTSDSVKVQFFAPLMTNMPILNLKQIVNTNSIRATASLIPNDAEGLPTDIYMWVDCEYTKTEQTENNQTAIKYCVYYQKYENGHWNMNEECSENSYPAIEINPFVSNWPLSSIPNPVPLFEFPLSIYQGRNSCNVNLRLVIHQLNGLTTTIWKQAAIPIP